MNYRHHGIVDTCDDCKAAPPTTTWGLGDVRCTPCSDVFREKIQAQRAAEWKAERAAYDAHVAGRTDDVCPDDGVLCSECCEHQETDHGVCYDCGEDVTQMLVMRAEYAFEGDR